MALADRTFQPHLSSNNKNNLINTNTTQSNTLHHNNTTQTTDLCTSSNNMWIDSHPITVDFDAAQETLIGRHFHQSFYPFVFCLTPTSNHTLQLLAETSTHTTARLRCNDNNNTHTSVYCIVNMAQPL